MDVTGWLQARATPRPLLVAVPGGREVRLAAERVFRERGWEPATSPAEADLLVVCGLPDASIGVAVERVWSQLPSPRARADLRSADHVVDELDQARAGLTDPERQRANRVGRASSNDVAAHQNPPQHAPAEHGEAHDAHAESSDGSENMHTMHGGDVAGLPMADRAPDRDGLTLDQLHVTLGPVLTDWPAGLVVRATLQGDVVQSAQVEVVGQAPANGSPWAGAPEAPALDSLARLLSVCGWPSAMRNARRLRDELLAGTVDDAELRRFARRLRRSRTLRWSTDGIGWLDDTHGDLAGDATQRWHRWVDAVDGTGPAGAVDRAPHDRARIVVEVLPGLLEGQELAAVRVLVASFDPELDTLVARRGIGAAR